MDKMLGKDSFKNSTPLRKWTIDSTLFYSYLVQTRAGREGTFINDRGFRHMNNPDDKTGVTFAFWHVKGR